MEQEESPTSWLYLLAPELVKAGSTGHPTFYQINYKYMVFCNNNKISANVNCQQVWLYYEQEAEKGLIFLPVLLLTYPEFKMYVYYVERKKKVDIYTMLSPIQNSFNLSLFSRYILSPKI